MVGSDGAGAALFHSLAALAPLGVFRTDPTGRLTFVNDQAARIAGLTMGASLRAWPPAVHPADGPAVAALHATVLPGASSWSGRLRLVTAEGAGRALELRVTPLGDGLGVLGTVEDV